MKFVKGSFIIQFIDEAPHKFETRDGWISQCGRYGFHKDGAYWIVSDIGTGMRIHKAKTRTACAEYCEAFKGHIAAAKSGEKYSLARKAMWKFLKGEEIMHDEWIYQKYKCSECDFLTVEAINFCQKCGADMREEGADAERK